MPAQGHRSNGWKGASKVVHINVANHLRYRPNHALHLWMVLGAVRGV